MKFDKRQALTWPAMITLFLFALVPLITMLITSFQSDAGGGFTLENYKEFFFFQLDLSQADRQDDRHESYGHHHQPRYRLSPRLYHGKKLKGLRNVILILVIIPFFTNQLVRVYSWLIFLQDGGILNNFLNIFGLYEDGMGLLYTRAPSS